MDGEIVAFGGGNPGVLSGGEVYAALPVPAVIAREGERAAQRFIEFFTANIRNPNTRMAYARAVYQFMAWAEERRLPLQRLNPIFISVYIEQFQGHMAPPSVKQHLAAIRMLFYYLVIGQVVPHNPASSVRGPKHVVKKGKTPVLKAGRARQLLYSIDTSTIVGLRDRAIIATMVYSFAPVGAVVAMNKEANKTRVSSKNQNSSKKLPPNPKPDNINIKHIRCLYPDLSRWDLDAGNPPGP